MEKSCWKPQSTDISDLEQSVFRFGFQMYLSPKIQHDNSNNNNVVVGNVTKKVGQWIEKLGIRIRIELAENYTIGNGQNFKEGA